LSKRSDERTKKLKISELIECNKCQSWKYCACNGISEPPKGKWACADCNQLPLLPGWGPSSNFVNTCPFDNFFCMIWLNKEILQRTTEYGDNQISSFDRTVLTFVNSNIHSVAELMEAKVQFLSKIFNNVSCCHT
jgi:hypothetical protein